MWQYNKKISIDPRSQEILDAFAEAGSDAHESYIIGEALEAYAAINMNQKLFDAVLSQRLKMRFKSDRGKGVTISTPEEGKAFAAKISHEGRERREKMQAAWLKEIRVELAEAEQ